MGSSKDAEKLRDLLQPYFRDLSKINADAALQHAQNNQRIVQAGRVPSYQPPVYIQPSFSDLQYWVYQSQHYAPVAQPPTPKGKE